MNRAIAVAVALALLSGGATARTGVPVQDYVNQPIVRADGRVLTDDRVRTAMISAVQRRQWQVGEDSPGRIVATYNIRGKHSMTVEIRYSPTMYSVVYRDSHNLEYSQGPRGPVIHPTYGKILRSLVDTINTELRAA